MTDIAKQPEEKPIPMNEQMYLDLVNQLKDKFDNNEYLMKRIQKQNMELKKEIVTAFGCMRILDNLIHNSYGVDGDIVSLSESLRGNLSTFVEDII